MQKISQLPKSTFVVMEKMIARTQIALLDPIIMSTGDSSNFLYFPGVHTEPSQKSKMNLSRKKVKCLIFAMIIELSDYNHSGKQKRL